MPIALHFIESATTPERKAELSALRERQIAQDQRIASAEKLNAEIAERNAKMEIKRLADQKKHDEAQAKIIENAKKESDMLKTPNYSSVSALKAPNVSSLSKAKVSQNLIKPTTMPGTTSIGTSPNQTKLGAVVSEITKPGGLKGILDGVLGTVVDSVNSATKSVKLPTAHAEVSAGSNVFILVGAAVLLFLTLGAGRRR